MVNFNLAIAVASLTLMTHCNVVNAIEQEPTPNFDMQLTRHRKIDILGVEIFYREAGSRDKPTILLLHGYPTSSRMFAGLMQRLAGDFHLLAPDFPGFGQSGQPSPDDFEYTFENYANLIESFLKELDVKKYSIYLMDYGAPVGLMVAERDPARVEALIVQNGNAYEEGLGTVFEAAKELWKNPTRENRQVIRNKRGDMRKVVWEYTHGTRNSEHISPDNWNLDFIHLQREGNLDIQVRLVEDYGNNVSKYARWQKYLRDHQPPTLIVWGANDKVFPPAGAYPYKRDLKNMELHLLNTGHFALEEDGEEIANRMREFLARHLMRP